MDYLSILDIQMYDTLFTEIFDNIAQTIIEFPYVHKCVSSVCERHSIHLI